MGVKQQQGFSLFELLVVLVIIAVFSMVAYPAMKQQLAQTEAHRVGRLLAMSLKQAKVTSYSNHAAVMFCLANDQYQCDKSAVHSILLFKDSNNNRVYDVDIDGLLHSHALQVHHGWLRLQASNRKQIQFAGDTGMPRGYFGHIKYCSTVDDNLSYQVSFSQTGRVLFKHSRDFDVGC